MLVVVCILIVSTVLLLLDQYTEVDKLLRDTLPEYVANCFLEAGFDTLDVIADMDVSNDPGNSIELIEEFIAKEFPGDPKYINNPKLSCHFLPGHHLRIVRFVQQVKHMINSKAPGAGRKRPSREPVLPRSKRSASTSTASSTDDSSTSDVVMGTTNLYKFKSTVRCKLAQWQ